jgi:hypothetical protein
MAGEDNSSGMFEAYLTARVWSRMDGFAIVLLEVRSNVRFWD